jgi:ionotropic glutamate receptor
VFTSGGVTMVGGLLNEIDMIKRLAMDLNFTVTWIESIDRSYGVYNSETEMWDGLIKLILEDKADLSNAYLSTTKSRSSVVSFTPGFFISEHGLFMKKPQPHSSWTTYLDVFDPEYWLRLTLMILVILIVTIVSFSLFERNSTITKPPLLKLISANILNGLSIVLLSFTNQDIPAIRKFNNSKANSIKLLMLTTLLFGVINLYVYNARLFSTLVAKHSYAEIKSLSDLVEHPKYKLILKEGTASAQYFSDEASYPHKQLWDKVLQDKENSIVFGLEVIESSLLQEGYNVYFRATYYVESSFKGYPCDIIKSPYTYFRRSSALAFQKESPYLKLFSSRIQHYNQYGIIDNMKGLKRNTKKSSKCTIDNVNQLGYKNIFSSFIFLGIGILFAFLNFCGEYLCGKRMCNITQ